MTREWCHHMKNVEDPPGFIGGASPPNPPGFHTKTEDFGYFRVQDVGKPKASPWGGKFLEVIAGASVAQQMNIEYRARSDEG